MLAGGGWLGLAALRSFVCEGCGGCGWWWAVVVLCQELGSECGVYSEWVPVAVCVVTEGGCFCLCWGVGWVECGSWFWGVWVSWCLSVGGLSGWVG